MGVKLGLVVLVMVIGLLLAFFAYKALDDDYSSGFAGEFRDSGEMVGHVITKALSKGDSALIRVEELLDDENLTEDEERKIKEKEIIIG